MLYYVFTLSLQTKSEIVLDYDYNRLASEVTQKAFSFFDKTDTTKNQSNQEFLTEK